MIAAAERILAAGALGVVSGLFGGLFGIGGGVLAIPLLGLAYGLHQQMAQGTVLVMVVPNVLFGLWGYRRRVGVDLRIGATLAVTATVSTYPAAHFATELDPHGLRLAFAAFLAILATLIAYRSRQAAAIAPARPPLAWGWTALVGVAGGIVSGLFGVGGAFIVPPALTAFFGLRQIEAQGLALALVSPVTLVALVTYARAGEVDWGLGIPLAVGGIAAIPAGVAAAYRRPARGGVGWGPGHPVGGRGHRGDPGRCPPRLSAARARPAPRLLRPVIRDRRAARAARVSTAETPFLTTLSCAFARVLA